MLQVQQSNHVVLSDFDPLEARKLTVIGKVRDLSASFTIRQVAAIQQMSIPYLAALAEKHDIIFLDNSGSRSKRIASDLIARERSHTQVMAERSIIGRKAVKSLGSQKINPALAELARRRDQEETNSFIDRLRELGKTNTKAQTAKAVGISPFFMRTLAYDHEISFVNEPVEDDCPVSREETLDKERLRETLFCHSPEVPESAVLFMRSFMMGNTPDEM
tara:strand:+ start:1436 stop:2092 length:657 start_codon:yes stop_codon:yes gene_type:complete